MVAGWLVGLVGMAALSASATRDLYSDEASLVSASDAINRSSALVALYGRIYDPTSLGAVSMIKMGGLGAIFVAMWSVVLAVRHTRGDEEAGRSELVGAAPVGRLAPLASALVVVAVANAALAVLTALSLVGAGLPADGSIAFGVAWAGVGLAFGGVAAVVAQLAGTARQATSLSAVVLTVTYVARAIGDAAGPRGATWLSWLSPIGWSQQFRPYAGNRWWVLLVTAAFAVAMVAVAARLAARRDLGAGLLTTGSGPSHAPRGLAGPGGLAWRLHRASLLGWAIGFVATGALVGSLAADVADFANNDSARQLFEKLGGQRGLTDAYLAVEFTAAAMVAAAFGIAIVVRMRAEEAELRAEPVLAAAVSRLRWAGAHLSMALGGPVVLLALAGAGAGGAHALRTHDGGQVGRLVVAALAQAPAVWVVVGVAALLFGLAPRRLAGAWALYGAFVLIAEIGPLLSLGSWFEDLSPFAHAPQLPGHAVAAPALVVLTIVGVGLVAGSLAAFRRRDVG
jgi:ABC-2 type transport system permease protein